MMVGEMEHFVERELAGKMGVLEENLLKFHCVRHKFHMNYLGIEPRLGEQEWNS
jgi:hypothetical protein